MNGSLTAISEKIEEALVARNLRGMAQVRSTLTTGYCLRAAQTLLIAKGVILIGTGFPVKARSNDDTSTFETDGPLGAIALYQALEKLGSEPYIVCGPPLSQAIMNDYRVVEIELGKHSTQDLETQQILDRLKPDAILSIERPGRAEDGRYYNMRGEDISAGCAGFDSFMDQATCPTIAIGDGGNEIGMGNVAEALKSLDIISATTRCDELIVADVSNWGCYGIIALLGKLAETDLLALLSPLEVMEYLSQRGSVDGLTRLNQLTEDGQSLDIGDSVISQLRQLSGSVS